MTSHFVRRWCPRYGNFRLVHYLFAAWDMRRQIYSQNAYKRFYCIFHIRFHLIGYWIMVHENPKIKPMRLRYFDGRMIYISRSFRWNNLSCYASSTQPSIRVLRFIFYFFFTLTYAYQQFNQHSRKRNLSEFHTNVWSEFRKKRDAIIVCGTYVPCNVHCALRLHTIKQNARYWYWYL